MEPTYDQVAEFNELYVPPSWEPLRDLVSDTFGDIGPDGVIVDIGAGSGLGSVLLAEVSDAEIIALEPNTTMRSMLMARLDQAGVLERVTVLAAGVPEGLDGLPDRVDGVVAAHMLGHLSRPALSSLLDWIATSLAPGRAALLTIEPEASPEGFEPMVFERAVGRHIYRTTYDIVGPGQVESLWEVIDQDQAVIRALHTANTWEPPQTADIRTALADHPVEITEPQAGVALISKPTN